MKNKAITIKQFKDLKPDRILAAVESQGFRCDGTLLPLNSFENRVYQVGIEEETPLVVKFYRPGRWPRRAIREEHAFMQELNQQGLRLAHPLADIRGNTLHRLGHISFALMPRLRGRNPDMEDPVILERIGITLGKVHAVGGRRRFEHRPTLDVKHVGTRACREIDASGLLPKPLRKEFQLLTNRVRFAIRKGYERVGKVPLIRLHGDCHPGNILLDGPVVQFMDFDDCGTGPAIQDLWTLMPDDAALQGQTLSHLLKGYTREYPFNREELHLVEPLRTLRMLHHAAWVVQHWGDPAFPKAFPHMTEVSHWENYLVALEGQLARLTLHPDAVIAL
ncbi:MAG: serine/threonine protein kinase [Magnetococcales bacterium]|nr:serine/threonine protein kinase [Magnetococcales bacterium]